MAVRWEKSLARLCVGALQTSATNGLLVGVDAGSDSKLLPSDSTIVKNLTCMNDIWKAIRLHCGF